MLEKVKMLKDNNGVGNGVGNILRFHSLKFQCHDKERVN